MKTKKLAILTLSFLAATLSSTAHAGSNCEERVFTTTAYYSPLPDQGFYILGDIDSDKYLNGQGTHGASGQPVEPGMLAAPQNYAFGGTINFPGFGKGVIRDRGGAIVNAGVRGHAHDRIDIWMGHGEEGLIRALIRGKQGITTTYCEGDQYEAATFSRDNMTIYKNFFDMAIIKFNLEEGRQDAFVRTLQEYLINLGYLKRDIPTGYFGAETRQAICNFQVDYGVVDSYTSERCGIYGPQTRAAFNNVFKKKGLYPANFWETASVQDVINQANTINNKIFGYAPQAVLPQQELVAVEKQTITKPEIIIEHQAPKNEIFGKQYSLGDSGFEIVYLQELLIDQGLYNSDISGIFDQATLDGYNKLQDIYDQQPIDFIVANLRQQFLASK